MEAISHQRIELHQLSVDFLRLLAAEVDLFEDAQGEPEERDVSFEEEEVPQLEEVLEGHVAGEERLEPVDHEVARLDVQDLEYQVLVRLDLC